MGRNYLKKQNKNMDGNKVKSNHIFDDLFSYAQEIMTSKQIYPYVSFIVKDSVVISRGRNKEQETFDLTNQDQVVSIREAQKTLDSGNLEGYSLYSFFEPTILGFDVALWSGVKDFHWCINSSSYPFSYNPMKYSVVDYEKDHPGIITIEAGVREKEALELVKLAEQNGYEI